MALPWPLQPALGPLFAYVPRLRSTPITPPATSTAYAAAA